MSTKSAFSIVGLMHKFGSAWERFGGTVAELNALAERPDRLADVLTLLRLEIEVPRTISHYKSPSEPRGLEVENHVVYCAPIDLARTRLGRFLAYGSFVSTDNGYQVEERIAEVMQAENPDRRPANATALDHLLGNPLLVPNVWYGFVVWFFGTTYKDGERTTVVRGLDCRTTKKGDVRECTRDLCQIVGEDLWIAFTEPY